MFLILVLGEIARLFLESAVSVAPRGFSLGCTPDIAALRGASSAEGVGTWFEGEKVLDFRAAGGSDLDGSTCKAPGESTV